MPIEIAKPMRALSEVEYRELVRRVIGISFAIHNEFCRHKATFVTLHP